MRTSPALRFVAALAAGIVFGFGLVLAGMTDPRKILNFLDVLGPWDPTLLFVLGGAVITTALGYRLAFKRAAPLLSNRFHKSGQTLINRPLVIGSALFGIGWGLAGYCPGPAVASLGLNYSEALWIVPAMIAGAIVQRWQFHARAQHRVPPDANSVRG